jgi:hypothetical protein
MIDEQEINDENDTVENLGIKAMYYNNIVDRYFTKYYFDKNSENEQYVFVHTNGLIMCGIGANNLLIKSGKKIKEIKDLNKLSKVSGKRKHGAHIVAENENLLTLTTEDSSEYNFCPKVKGKLVEINSNIFTNADLILKSPEKHGFICFLLSDHKNIDGLKEKLDKLTK